MEVKSSIHQKLCKGLLSKVIAGGHKTNVYRVVSDDDLKDISLNKKQLIDRQTIVSSGLFAIPKKTNCVSKII